MAPRFQVTLRHLKNHIVAKSDLGLTYEECEKAVGLPGTPKKPFGKRTNRPKPVVLVGLFDP